MNDPNPEPQDETLDVATAATGAALSFTDSAMWVIEAGGEGVASSISDLVTSSGELDPL